MVQLNQHLRLILLGGCILAAYAGSTGSGFWYDEAYTARLASLSFQRSILGAMQDIHPPGWTIISWLSHHIPFISTEIAQRMPSVLGFGAIAWLLSRRSVVPAAALLFHSSFVDQASQGRAYIVIPLGLLLILLYTERGRYRTAALLTVGVASLHTVSILLSITVLVINIQWNQVSRRMLAECGAILVLGTAWWMPDLMSAIVDYSRSPWYQSASLNEWLSITDGVIGLFVTIPCILLSGSANRRLLVTIVVLSLELIIPDLLGLGMKPDRLGLSLIMFGALLIGRSTSNRFMPSIFLAGIVVSSAPVSTRPDLRAAQRVIDELPLRAPVLAWHASEFNYYQRLPASIWVPNSPEGSQDRANQVAHETGSECIIVVTTWGNSPSGQDRELSVIAGAEVPGLELRLLGTTACRPPHLPDEWIPSIEQE